jgi:hypothetical protein
VKKPRLIPRAAEKQLLKVRDEEWFKKNEWGPAENANTPEARRKEWVHVCYSLALRHAERMGETWTRFVELSEEEQGHHADCFMPIPPPAALLVKDDADIIDNQLLTDGDVIPLRYYNDNGRLLTRRDASKSAAVEAVAAALPPEPFRHKPSRKQELKAPPWDYIELLDRKKHKFRLPFSDSERRQYNRALVAARKYYMLLKDWVEGTVHGVPEFLVIKRSPPGQSS